MQQELSILSLILNASLVVKLVIVLLLIFSVISWSIIISKWALFAKIKFATNGFLRQFRNTTNITSLYNEVCAKSHRNSVVSLFFSALNEFNKLNKQGIKDNTIIVANIERILAATLQDEVDRYERQLSILATFGSVSPYIGLLGTVWGIMHAFIGLGNAGQATLSSVAPGIAEALVATAFGLFVAIPAYIFYNKFTDDTNSLANKMNKFADELLNLISRQI